MMQRHLGDCVKRFEQGRRVVSHWFLILLVLPCLGLLSGCNLPQVSAEDRLFLKLNVEVLDEYRLPKQDFQNTPVGGLSAIAYDPQQDRLYAQSDDRGDRAAARFYTLKLNLDGTNPQQPKIKNVAVEKVTTLRASDGQPFSPGTVDLEGIALSPLRSLFISSEGVTRAGVEPFVAEFDRNGQWKRNLPIPQRYIPDAPGGEQTQGVRDNLGFEALTLNPGGYGTTGVEPFRLFTATESSLAQDMDPANPPRSRLLHYLLEEGKALLLAEHLYPLDAAPEGTLYHGLTELLAIDQGGHFLSLERTFGSYGFGAKLFQITLGGATDTSTIASLKGELKGVQPIQKKLLLDFAKLPIDNLEGMTFGPRLPDGSQSLILVSDDNFRLEQFTQFWLLRLSGKR